MKKQIIVVGGGAAGMMAAYASSLGECEVHLYEKNEKLGKKVYITGKGRCNVTNAGDTNEFFEFVNSNHKFLYSSIYGFDAFQVMELIEKNGCSLKVERGNRVFPDSDHSSDIIRTFERMLHNNDVSIHKNTKVDDLYIKDNVCKGIIVEGRLVHADAVIICTGGASYQSTGSDGQFIRLLEKYGIGFEKLRPGLVPLCSPDPICKDLMGLSLKNVGLDFYVDKKNIYSGFGEMLFTHFGMSGPLCLTASSVYNKKYYGKKALAVIDLKPALSREQLDKRILRDFDNAQNKAFKTVLNGLLPKSLAALVPEILKIDGDKKINEVTSEERNQLVSFLKAFEIEISGTRDFNEAIITIGGISTKHINPSTMELKSIKHLYVAGEMIDVDAFTGGYNLQIAWSTGYLAGISCAQDI